jgi:hypothetical protein
MQRLRPRYRVQGFDDSVAGLERITPYFHATPKIGGYRSIMQIVEK